MKDWEYTIVDKADVPTARRGPGTQRYRSLYDAIPRDSMSALRVILSSAQEARALQSTLLSANRHARHRGKKLPYPNAKVVTRGEDAFLYWELEGDA